MPPEVPQEDRPERFVRSESSDNDEAQDPSESAEVVTESDPRFDEGASAESTTIADPEV